MGTTQQTFMQADGSVQKQGISEYIMFESFAQERILLQFETLQYIVFQSTAQTSVMH